jgi:predicted protein tyrosine phosphatase
MSTSAFVIATVPIANGGRIGICPAPGGAGDGVAENLSFDLAAIADWKPDVVLSLIEPAEWQPRRASALVAVLAAQGILHLDFPIRDYGVPSFQSGDWHALSDQLHGRLDGGGSILIHCRGGCGRSGMVALRLLIEAGETADQALSRLRAIRPCAIETDGQMAWAKAGQAPA